MRSPTPVPQADHVSLAQMLEGEVRPSSETQPEQGGSKKGLVIGIAVFLGLVAAAAGVAFAMGWIP